MCVCGVSFAFKQLKNLNKLNKVGATARSAPCGFIVCVFACVKNKLKMVIFIILHVVSKNNQVRDLQLRYFTC